MVLGILNDLLIPSWKNLKAICFTIMLDLRFADGILFYGESAQAVGSMLDALVTCVEQVGLKLNASKTKV